MKEVVAMRLTCEDVCFSYGKGRNWRINREFCGGTTYQLIGPNGSGKSTIGKVLTRIESPQQGVIAVDGRSAGDMTRAELLSTFLYVPQEPQWLFFGESFCKSMRWFNRKSRVCGDGVGDGADGPGKDEIMDEVTRMGSASVFELSSGDVFLLALFELHVWIRPIAFIDEYPDFDDPAHQAFVAAILQKREKSGLITFIARHMLADIGSNNGRTLYMDEMVAI